MGIGVYQLLGLVIILSLGFKVVDCEDQGKIWMIKISICKTIKIINNKINNVICQGIIYLVLIRQKE